MVVGMMNVGCGDLPLLMSLYQLRGCEIFVDQEKRVVARCEKCVITDGKCESMMTKVVSHNYTHDRVRSSVDFCPGKRELPSTMVLRTSVNSSATEPVFISPELLQMRRGSADLTKLAMI